MPRIKTFGWLLLVDRLNTKDMLQRRRSNVQSGINCVMCRENQRETRDHLFFECEFAKQCWIQFGIAWEGNLNVTDRIQVVKHVLGNPFYMDVFFIAALELWKLWNVVIFDNQHGTHQIWIECFEEQVHLQS